MDLFEEDLTVDEKIILFNTCRRALNSMVSGFEYGAQSLKYLKSAKFQTLEKVLCLLAEELDKNNCSVFTYGSVSDADTIKSVISGYVAN